jgi:nitrogen fixation NifU-like protein
MTPGPYGEVIQDHFRHPRNYGALENADIRNEDVNPFCGDRVRIELTLGADETIKEARFQGDLCMIAKAASSILTGMIAGRSVGEIGSFPEQQLFDALEAPIHQSRRQCVLLPLTVLQAGVTRYMEARGT